MPNPKEKIEGKEAPDSGKKFDFKGHLVVLAEDSYQQGFMSQQSYDFHRQIATEGHKDARVNDEMLQKLEVFSLKQNAKAKELIGHIQKARLDKIASETDEAFLMQHLKPLIQSPDFVRDFAKTENTLLEKIKRMKKNREAFDGIRNHPLARNTGFLKTDEKTKLNVPKEDEFLKMTVPQRREWLKKAQEALPKAIKYAEKAGEGESKDLTEKYTKLLNGTKNRKIIGRKTYDKFLDGFAKIDRTEKGNWVKEFDGEIKRYEKLWGDIRGTLKGVELQHMESLRDQMGYTELFTEFGRVCEAEGKRIEGQYETRLNKYAHEEKIIGKHTVREFMDGEDSIRRQDLKGKTKYLDQLDGQMVRYRQLWKEIGTLPKKAQDFLEPKRDEWGYTKIHDQFQRFKNGEKVPETGPKNDPLSVVQNTTVRRAITETSEKLKQKGGDKRKTFLHRIRMMFMGAQETNFDAKGFGAKLREGRQETKKKEREEITPDRNSSLDDFQKEFAGKRQAISSAEMDKGAVEKEIDAFGLDERSHVLKVEGFRQVKTLDDSGHTKRSAQVEINRDKGMEQFFLQEQQHAYRGKEQGGKDDLSLAVKSEDTGVVEMKLRDIRAMEKFLEEEEKLDKAT